MPEVDVKKAVLFYRTIEKEKPEIIQEYEESLKRLPILFNLYILLPTLLNSFSSYHEISPSELVGTRKGFEFNHLKKKFVAAMVLCYHPDMITGHDQKIVDRLCMEIAGLLQVKREQISNYAKEEISSLSATKKGVYAAYRKEMFEIVQHLKEDVKQPELNETEGIDLFQEA